MSINDLDVFDVVRLEATGDIAVVTKVENPAPVITVCTEAGDTIRLASTNGLRAARPTEIPADVYMRCVPRKFAS